AHDTNRLKIHTPNPPGREMGAIVYLRDVLTREGLKVDIQDTAPERGNLVVRVKGSGEKRPLLIQSHVDVVNAEPQFWKHDPFGAVEDDGFIYGRGAIDMKNFTAMCLMAVLKAHREKWPLKRDLIMAAVSDEETGAKYGMGALVDERPDWIRAEYALGEVGGYTIHVGGRPVYPIQVGEKGVLWLEVTLNGEPGHGSIPRPENVHWKLANFLSAIHKTPFPYHPTDSFRAFIKGLQRGAGPAGKVLLSTMLTPMAPFIQKQQSLLKRDQTSAGLLAMMTNTVNPTGLVSGRQHNVVPSTVTLKLDCRVIPGIEPGQVVAEIERVTGEKLEYKIIQYQKGHQSPMDTELFNLICSETEAAHPGATAVPWLTVGFTDAAQLQKLGTICYGFTPVKLGPDIEFSKLYHGHNERIPVDGFLWGVELFTNVVRRFCC
ncbi:MAG TPA: M20/M25/M40 family metallo-hydrolase, partial [Bdellovibrionales bacterium]|nr:M20/M25/M40 family metallo-hydrolase [Bdellovibrionales bacterium]